MPLKETRVFALTMLNSSLEDAEIIPFLDALVAQGYEGICLHPRDGLREPYGTPAYWQKISHIIGLARERELAIWHYDEYPYPSGMAGGAVLDGLPERCAQTLRFVEISTRSNRNGVIDLGPDFLLALLRVDGEAVEDVSTHCGPYLKDWQWGSWDNSRYTGTLNVHLEYHERGHASQYTRGYVPCPPLSPGEQLIAVYVDRVSGQRGQIGVPDVTQPEVTDLFLKLAYEPLARLSEEHKLGPIPVFQDEVNFGSEWPWNKLIERRLRDLWGANFAARLLALHAPGRAHWETARYQYRSVCRDLLEENWFKRVTKRAHELGLQTTGHLAGEESILGHCLLMGDAFRMLSCLDIPGYDIISSTLPDDLNRGQALGAKLVQSAAWLCGKSTMVEAFGANGHHLDAQKSHSILAWLALHDHQRIFDHATYVSAHGPRKYEAPPINTRFNPLSIGNAAMWQWHAWLCDLLDEYRFTPRTLVLFPIESFARYTLGERDLWKAEASLLETWFHTLCCASMDCLLIPSEELDNVLPKDGGFEFGGHHFVSFIVPPVVSLREETWLALQPFVEQPGFLWHVAEERETKSTIAIFDGEISERDLPQRGVRSVREEDLLSQRAAWFLEDLPLDLRAPRCTDHVLHSKRYNENGDELRVVVNPNDWPVELRFESCPGSFLTVENGDTVSGEFGSLCYQLAAREVAVWRYDGSESTDGFTAEETYSSDLCLTPTQARFRYVGHNGLALTDGLAYLDGEDETTFSPKPVSSLWPEVLGRTSVGFSGPYNRDGFSTPRELKAVFDFTLSEDLKDLAIVLDADSVPPRTALRLNGELLNAESRALYDIHTTVYPVPPELLKAGEYQLVIRSSLDNGVEGILEYPILSGSFLCHDNRLFSMPQDWQEWDGASWTLLGLPEGFGPVDYEWIFGVEQPGRWKLLLPPCIGVAEVWANGVSLGQSLWEPRVLPLEVAEPGEYSIRARLHGSWNNLFSRLNRLENGFSGMACLQLENHQIHPNIAFAYDAGGGAPQRVTV